MKLSFNTSAYVHFPIERTIGSLAQLGYGGIEIARTHPVHEMSRQDRKKLLRFIKSHGLAVSCVQGGSPPRPYPEIAKKRIDLAADLECHVVNLGPGSDVEEEKERERNWKEVVEIFRELAEYAASRDVTVTMEAEPPSILSGQAGKSYPRLIGTLKDLERMLRDVEAQNFGVTFDISHIYAIRENPLNVIEKVRDRIVHVHVGDNVNRVGGHLIPGTGIVDFEGPLRALGRVGYKGFLSVELERHVFDPDGAALQSIQYMDSLLCRIGLK
jgi:sugar phosphate isomerase/epimerase